MVLLLAVLVAGIALISVIALLAALTGTVARLSSRVDTLERPPVPQPTTRSSRPLFGALYAEPKPSLLSRLGGPGLAFAGSATLLAVLLGLGASSGADSAAPADSTAIRLGARLDSMTVEVAALRDSLVQSRVVSSRPAAAPVSTALARAPRPAASGGARRAASAPAPATGEIPPAPVLP